MEFKLEDIAKDLVRSKTFPELVLSLESRGVDVPERELLLFLLREIVVPKLEFDPRSTERAFGRSYFFRSSLEKDPVNIWYPTYHILMDSTDVLKNIVRVPDLISCLRECVLFLNPNQVLGNGIAEERISFLVDLLERMFPGVVRTIRFADSRDVVSEIFSKLEIVRQTMEFARIYPHLDQVVDFAKDALRGSGCIRLISKLLFTWRLNPILDGEIPVWKVFGCRDLLDLKLLLDMLK